MTDRAAHAHEHRHAHEHADDLRVTGIEAFGVRVSIAAPPALLPRLTSIMPPGSRSREPAEGDERFVLRRRANNVYRVERAHESVSGSSDLQIALEVLATRLREHVALHAPDHIFVHAGVVAHAGRAIVMPGLSFSGKTTLVTALVRAGATYLSDEYAVLDADGLVHPYPKPLSLRLHGLSQVDHDVTALGGRAGEDALPVGLVALTQYAPGAKWSPRRLSTGEAVLGLLANTIPAQERPDQSLAAISKAVAGATALEGPRGEAAEIVDQLLAAAAHG